MRTCSPPCRAISVPSELKARPLLARTRMGRTQVADV
jgi:hypothetical protein